MGSQPAFFKTKPVLRGYSGVQAEQDQVLRGLIVLADSFLPPFSLDTLS